MPESATTVRVQLSDRSYDIVIGTGNLAEFDRFFKPRVTASHVVVMTDRNVEKPYATRVVSCLESTGIRADLVVLEPGEATKSVAQADALWQELPW